MPKISARKLILCELLHLYLNAKIIILTEKDFACGTFLWKRHSKGKFHVLFKELKLFDYEFFFKHIAIRHFDFSQRYFTVFILFFNRLHSVISSTDNPI